MYVGESNSVTQFRHLVVTAEQLCWSYDKAIEILGNNVARYSNDITHDKIICYVMRDIQQNYKLPNGLGWYFNQLFIIPENAQERFCAFNGGLESILKQVPDAPNSLWMHWEDVHAYIDATYTKIAQSM
jgi:hypothetical protein